MSNIGAAGDFAVSTTFNGPRAVVAFRGELDRLTGNILTAALDAVIADGQRSVSVDLSECRFIDAFGLGVLVRCAKNLRLSGGTLSVRSPSTVTARVLRLTGLDWLIAPGILDGSADQPRLDSTVASTRRFTAASHPGWAPRRLTNAAITNPHDVIDGALRLVVGLARTAVAGADGASVSLRRGGQLSTVAASDQTVLDMDADQYGTGEGPCVDASVVGRSFYAESLATETRWSSFTPRAQALGIQAILSSPLIVSERPIGALNMYSRTTNGFSDEDQRLASIFASQASAILAETDTDVTAERLAWRLSEALRSRQTIALAQGIIMERMGVGDERAYTELRRFSLRHQWSLRQQAEDIVASSQGTGSAERPASDDDTRD